MIVLYTAACPACGRDATWTTTGNVFGMHDEASLIVSIDCSCSACPA